MKIALCTGCTGQDGALLSKFLLDKNYIVVGMSRRTSSPTDWRLKELALYDNPNFHIVSGDLTDQGSIDKIVKNGNFDEIYNLGAQSFVGSSWDCPISTLDINGLGAVRIFEAVKNLSPKTKVYQASSSEMFGFGAQSGEPINEDGRLTGKSPYGVSKITAHLSARDYVDSHGLFISRGILFNHESEYRGFEFVTRKISHNVARIFYERKNNKEVKPLQLGCVDSCRDWGHAEDYVKAMWLMLQQDEPDEFVIATGESHSIAEFCDIAFDFAGMDWKIYVDINDKFKRPSDIKHLLGDSSKAYFDLGWGTEIEFSELVLRMVKKDIERYRKNHGK
jgi:GDPmannose 4,6-dehydratase